MTRLKDTGKVSKIGISIYSPDELEIIWPHFPFDLVQSPFNVFDRRLATSGWLKRLHQEGVEIHVRSVFLQGLLLAESDGLPVGFKRWTSLWAAWHAWLRDVSCSPLPAALGHVLSFPEISRVIVGVDSLGQLEGILRYASARQGVAPQVLMSDDLDLIDPTRWSALL
jgi:aryl-alcohol dehydrogenase-like predicted oxidoreductase